jgi:flavin-dependent dehydrogenase
MLDPHGSNWHIDRSAFDNALANTAQALGVEHIFVPSFSRLEIGRVGKAWAVQTGHLETSISLRSDILVDGSGLARVLARSLGGVAMRDDLLAIAWTVVEDHEDHSALLIEACPEGWWYSLGQPDGSLLCALVVDARDQAKSGEARTTAWQRAWEQSRYSRERVPYRPARLSISIAESGRLSSLHGEGWFAIGDAATSFDPLSSNGLCSAIEQSIALTQVIAGGATSIERRQYADALIDNFECYRTQRRTMYKCVARFSHHDFWLSRSH